MILDGAACRAAVRAGEADPSWWFPALGERAPEAKAICAACPVRAECLDLALRNGESGIWGGLSVRERQRIPLRRRECDYCGATFVYANTERRRLLCSQRCAELRHAEQKQERQLAAAVARQPGKFLVAGHGRISRYRSGCRCKACRYAARVARARQRMGAA